MRRTLERSQRVEQRQKRWSGGDCPQTQMDGQVEALLHPYTSPPLSILLPWCIKEPVRLHDNLNARHESRHVDNGIMVYQRCNSIQTQHIQAIQSYFLPDNTLSCILLKCSQAGDSDAGASSPVTIVISPASPEKPPTSRQVDKRSTSTMNLKQMSEPGISKRLSSSSATLIKSPDKRVKQRSSSCNRLPNNGNAAQASKEDGKKLQVEPTGRSLKKRSSSLTRLARQRSALWTEGSLVACSPTQASLARSKSAAALSAEGTNAPECHLCPRSASASPLNPPRGAPVRSRSIDRQKSGMTTSVSADGALDPSMKDKTSSSPGVQRPASPSSTLGRNRSPSPAPNPAPKRTPSPAPNPAPNPAPKRTPSPASKQNSKTRPPSPGAMKQRPPSPGQPPPIQKPALTPTGPPTLRKRDSKSKDMCPVLAVSPLPSESSKSKEKDDSKGSTGTNSAAEAAKILAENRRLMREQKEKEEQLRLQREEEEKVRKEEEMRLAEEARLIRLEEDKKLAEDKKIKERKMLF
ncbi:hypothetical protein F7725_010371 [Dissostichus mawsoni]|uniref:Uncharacterized protein n=1 Tax=Dissostichus mawsoni TaxID=36200 RepID=A0A7J5XP14_DISMA|nr:hypothetical protein F7725_010371 [Dissostichus mawsoni]